MSNAQTPSDTPKPSVSVSRFVMPSVVLGFLGAHMVFILFAITLAVGDPSFAVVPDYYRKAVGWDEHKAQLAASSALGWQVEVAAARDVEATGERELTLVLHDSDGKPITGALINVSMYHHARAQHVVEAVLLPTGEPGRYTARPVMHRKGLWDISLTITHGELSYYHAEKTYVQGSSGGRPR